MSSDSEWAKAKTFRLFRTGHLRRAKVTARSGDLALHLKRLSAVSNARISCIHVMIHLYLYTRPKSPMNMHRPCSLPHAPLMAFPRKRRANYRFLFFCFSAAARSFICEFKTQRIVSRRIPAALRAKGIKQHSPEHPSTRPFSFA